MPHNQSWIKGMVRRNKQNPEGNLQLAWKLNFHWAKNTRDPCFLLQLGHIRFTIYSKRLTWLLEPSMFFRTPHVCIYIFMNNIPLPMGTSDWSARSGIQTFGHKHAFLTIRPHLPHLTNRSVWCSSGWWDSRSYRAAVERLTIDGLVQGSSDGNMASLSSCAPGSWRNRVSFHHIQYFTTIYCVWSKWQ